MRRCFLPALSITLIIISVLFIHKVSPTNLAGPGLDIPVYVMAIIIGIAFFANGLKSIRRGNEGSYILFYVNVAGFILISSAILYALKKWN